MHGMKRRHLLHSLALAPLLASGLSRASASTRTLATWFGTPPTPSRIARVFATGAPAAVLVYVLAPEKLLGWPSYLDDEARRLLPRVPAELPHLGRLSGRGSTMSTEALLALKPDLVLDAGSVTPTHVSGAERAWQQTGLPYALVDGRLIDTPAQLRETGTLLGTEERGKQLAGQAQRVLDLAQAVSDGEADSLRAPVRLTVQEQPVHRARFGVGASSNTGARVEASYSTIDFLRQAWELDTGVRLEEKRQTFYSDVFLPPLDDGVRYGAGFVAEQSDIEQLRIQRQSVGVQRIEQRGRLEERLSLNWQHEKRQPGDGDWTTSRALVPNVTWTWRKLDQMLDPRRGVVLQLSVGGGAKSLLSDENFLRLYGRSQIYLPIGARDTLSLRAELGRTFAPSRQHVPQDYLFRTGGTGSVRGYPYQSLGIKEGNATVGGRYLATASIEYTHWLNDSWGAAAFVDAGDAVDALQDARLAVGYGLGARWRSPAGPIGVDLAYGKRSRDLLLHFSLAIPF